VRAELQAREEAPPEGQRGLASRGEAFTQARVSLNAAPAPSQSASCLRSRASSP